MDVTYESPGSRPTRERSLLGMSPREMRTLLAVMSHERIFGQGPLTREVALFLGRIQKPEDTGQPTVAARAATLIRFGWLTASGPTFHCQRLSATAKCWRVFGFTKEDPS